MALRVSARAMSYWATCHVGPYNGRMGCLPLPIFMLLGCGIGWLAGEKAGSIYGAGIGLLIGAVLTVLLFRAMRKGNR
jgi:hypothetical protein